MNYKPSLYKLSLFIIYIAYIQSERYLEVDYGLKGLILLGTVMVSILSYEYIQKNKVDK